MLCLSGVMQYMADEILCNLKYNLKFPLTHVGNVWACPFIKPSE